MTKNSPRLSLIAGTLFAVCEAKDPALFGRLWLGSADDFWREWKKVYPEDFPEKGMTQVTDIGAIVQRRQG